ncbi:MAG: hypothetical protein J07HX64_00707 [halophilic archaeon J07HX64]|nr:MAG: hypothetical protein J07HX64_00707 [halophilic archaeon J07HX64]
MLALVFDFRVYPFVFAVDVTELVSMRATVTAQLGKAGVQTSSFTVESSHLLTVGEPDELWRGQLFAVVSDDHSSHIFPHPSVECQHAVGVVACPSLFDFDGERQFVVGVTSFAARRLELWSR